MTLEEREKLTRDRMRAIIAAGRFDPAKLGLKGSAGFMGTGTYTSTGREPGYRSK